MANEWNVDASQIAENYERFLVPAIFQPSAERLLDVAALRPGDAVLDVACGTGVVACLAAERVGGEGRVVGLDLLPDMLNVARQKPSPGADLTWEQSTADNMPFPDASFDAVLCQHGLQFFPDKTAALREMRRVTVPGGKLTVAVVANISHTPALAALADSFERHIGPAPAQFVRLVGAIGDEDSLRSIFDGTGYDDIDVRTETLDVTFPSGQEFVRRYLAGTPLAANPAVSDAEPAALEAVAKDVTSVLSEITPGGNTFATEYLVLTARAG